MTDDLEELKRRLVVGHKADGRSVYDEAAKSEVVALCLRAGASVSRVARECGINANQVTRWLREHGHGRRPRTAIVDTTLPQFVAVPLPPASAGCDGDTNAGINLLARLPNGVAVDLRGVHRHDVGQVIEALGRLRCSASTKG